MKKENVQNTSEKRSVNDFEHRMTIQLTEQHYIDYAMAHSQDQIKKGRQRAILWAVLFTVVWCGSCWASSTGACMWPFCPAWWPAC